MKKGEWVTGLGLLGACALCCTLPLIGAVGALGISSFLLNPFIVAGMALTLLLVGIIIYRRRKVTGMSCAKTGCSCNSCAAM